MAINAEYRLTYLAVAPEPGGEFPVPGDRFSITGSLEVSVDGAAGSAICVNVWALDGNTAWIPVYRRMWIWAGMPRKVDLPVTVPLDPTVEEGPATVYLQVISTRGAPTALVAFDLDADGRDAPEPIITESSVSLENYRVLSGAARLYAVGMLNTTGGTAYLLLFDRSTAPVDGVTIPIKAFEVASGKRLDYRFSEAGVQLFNGLGLAGSTAPAVYTEPAGGAANKCWFDAEIRLGFG